MKEMHIKNSTDLNREACSLFDTPMSIACRRGLDQEVQYLIASGVTERPLSSLFTRVEHEDFIDCLDVKDVEKAKQLIHDQFKPCLNESASLEAQSKIAYHFINTPSDALSRWVNTYPPDARIAGDSLQFLPFFIWLAKNNQTDLFSQPLFIELMKKNAFAALWSLPFAALFNANDYIVQCFSSLPVDAIRNGFRNMNFDITMCRFNDDTKLAIIKSLFNNSPWQLEKFKHEEFKNRITKEEVLFFATRLACTDGVKYLLMHGVKSDAYGVNPFSSLQLAASQGHIEIINLLLKMNPKLINQPLDNPPLHIAIQVNNLEAALLLVQHNADIYAKDSNGKTALDYLDDPIMKDQLINEYKKRQKNTMHFLKSMASFFHVKPLFAKRIEIAPLNNHGKN